jgi:hypothetical protein
MRKRATPLGLNAIGKPYSSSFDPNYRLKHVTSTAHLRWPYPTTMRFVDDPLNYNPNLRCFRGDQWWTQLHTQRQTQRRKQQQQPEPEKSAAATLTWKENARKSEFTAQAFGGRGRYILAPFLHCWNVDYCKRRGRERQQLGFAYSFDEAKAIAQTHADGAS